MVISEEVQNAILDATAALVNGGTLVFREGSTTLVTFTLKTPAFAAAAGGSAALDVVSPTMSGAATAAATTAADNYQFRTSGGAARLSGSIGEIDSGAEIELNHPDLELNDLVTIDEYTLSMPAGT